MNRFDLPDPEYTGTLALWVLAAVCLVCGFLLLGVMMLLGATVPDAPQEVANWVGRAMVGSWGAGFVLLVLGAVYEAIRRLGHAFRGGPPEEPPPGQPRRSGPP